jgi:CopA family copper-resistance protein
MKPPNFSRRDLFKGATALGALAALEHFAPSYARAAIGAAPQNSPGALELTIAKNPLKIDSRVGNAMTINGSVPGPIVRLREGTEAVIRVTNRMDEDTSIHWHGVLLPFEMDGVPGASYPGIYAGKTFEYRFPMKQNGTYWYHSHTRLQEQSGVYGPIIIDPAEPEPFTCDRDYVVMLSDWTFEDPHDVMDNLKKHSDYYNFQKRTAATFLDDAKDNGLSKTIENYAMWSQMRMMATDLLDVTGHTYTYLMNGLSPASNWTGIFAPGEKIRLRFINGSAMTVQDIRIPGLKMTVVAADGQNVQPVEVDELRIGVAEVYDVIVQPKNDQAYTLFAETLDRSGYARGTLAPGMGMSAPIPQRRKRPIRSMKDMGMMHGVGDMMLHEEHEKPDMKMDGMQMDGDMKSHDMKSHDMKMADAKMEQMETPIPGAEPVMHSKNGHGPGNQVVPMMTQSRLSEPGIGLGDDGRRVLVYTDLKAVTPFYDQRPPQRELEIHLTGHMERYMWSFDGKKFTEMPHVEFKHGERLRLTLVNDTMMEHPIHLHGMWMNLENGHGAHIPRKHTILVKPAARVSSLVTADAPGLWAFHCHYLYHMEMGMFRFVRVADAPLEGRDKLPQIPLIKSMMHDPKSHTTTQHNAHEMGGHR